MKKQLKMIVSLVAVVILLFTMAGCDGGSSDVFTATKGSLTQSSSVLQKDDDMVVDGIRNETQYQNPLSFTETNTGTTVTTYVHLGNQGIYCFIEVDDKSVYISEEKEFYENDTVEVYIDPNPSYSISLQALSQSKVRNDCLHIRANCQGQYQTWYGRTMEFDKSQYTWILGYFQAEVAGTIDGTLNTQNGANGYTVEIYIPWTEFGLTEKPDEVGVLPAFNNVHNREDTSRTWFSVKGMSHTLPTSYGRVDDTGFVDVGYSTQLTKQFTANWQDEFYADATEYTISEVQQDNSNPIVRATVKAVLGDDAVYLLANVKDKVYTNGNDNIWANDGIELMFDTTASYVDNVYRYGIHRIAVDVDGGVETDISITGYNDYVPYRQAVFSKVQVSQISDEGYGYKYSYVYEIAIPYSTLGFTEKPTHLTFAWAVQSPNEVSYVLDRQNGLGEQEGQGWLWTDGHYPGNPAEYYDLYTSSGNRHFGDEIADISGSNTVKTDVADRYTIKAVAKSSGLSVEMTQFVNSFELRGSSDSKWTSVTHIEFELWQGDVGYGWDGTYFAIFCNGDYYVNNTNGITDLKVSVDIVDRGADYDGYSYAITYKMFIGFANNVNSSDGPYAYVKFYSYTPYDTEGYPTANVVERDGRVLYTDDCVSYKISKFGIDQKMYS